MSVCNNQDTFNDAVYKALKYSKKKEDKKISRPLAVYLVIHLIFLVWAIMLAFKTSPDNRVVHITLAIIFAPAYCLAYYMNAF
jgi:succinate-acetate transporter protein